MITVPLQIQALTIQIQAQIQALHAILTQGLHLRIHTRILGLRVREIRILDRLAHVIRLPTQDRRAHVIRILVQGHHRQEDLPQIRDHHLRVPMTHSQIIQAKGI